ncbi:CHASE domain-containing protein [Pseudoduganella umbonata]|uniref:Sensory/regulatory protein RpfC n=1 Tax=Pseudoduganella umbonata TaxID=864828 RepID=A0A4P8HMJ9_9BURK|nr:CHASE domain-containing protein [Pseudoduganella umbonata]MBB3219488.1 PAS domain S-box-containing protein [Pseudoduganella umbonata]QCP09570.1 response regulator [Pseudoduganella umbonata]
MKTRSGPLIGNAGRIVLCTLAYVLAAAACIALAIPTGNHSPVWLPTGIALAAVLHYRRPMLIAVAAGSMIVNLYLMAGRPLAPAAAIAAASAISAGNVLATAVAWWLIRHAARTLRRDSPLVVYGYVLATVLASTASGTIGGCTLAVAGIVSWNGLGPVIALWSLGDATAMLLATPLVAAWTSRSALRPLRLRRAALPLAALLATTALAAAAVFQPAADGLPDWAPLALLIPAIGAGYLFGAPGGTAAAAIVAAGAIRLTLAGAGPFATRDQFHSLLSLHLYLALMTIAVMLMANTAPGWRRPAGSQRPGRWPMATLALCLGITATAWHAVALHAERRIGEQFGAIVDLTWQQMDYRIANYRRILMAGKAFFDASEEVTAAEWHDYVADFDVERAFPGTLGVGYATWLRSAAEAEAFVQRRRADGPAYRLWPEPVRWPVAAVTYLAPRNAGNARPLGYNMMEEINRRNALTAANASGGIGSTSTILLVHDFERRDQRGFLMFLPLYRKNAPTATPAQREAALRGFIYSPFRVHEMVGSLLGRHDAFSLRIVDLHAASGGREIYRSAARDLRGSRYVKPLAAVRTLAIDEAGHRWRLEFTASPSFESGIDRQGPLLTLGLGALISFLLFSIVRGLASTRARALEIAQQITRQLQWQQRAARQSEERFRLFTASVRSHAIIFLDAAGHVEAWNDGAANLFGHTDGEAIGRALDLWADPERGRALLAEAMAGDSATAVTELVRRDGARFLGELQLTAVRRDGVPTGFACIVRDVTAARAAEEQLRQAVAIAQSASRAKSAFVANMSHELRTPMNGVLGIAALLERGALDKEQRELVRMIRSAGETLLAVLNDILDFSKIEAGKVELHPEPVALDDVALACARLMAVNGGGRLRVLVDMAPALPATIEADALRLEQILTNLIGNALKFTEQGAVECRFGRATLDGAPALRVDVTDTGIGIDPEQQKRLFSAFAQADASTTRRFGGTGLGLTIARTLATLMGGTLDVASTPGAGSTFTLTVPLREVAAPDRYALPPAHMHLSVLVCEPETRVVSALANATARWGWHLHVAHDPARVGLLLAAPGTLPWELAIVGPGIDTAQVIAALATRRAQLPPDFALIRILDGFAVPTSDTPVPFPAAAVHAPATRAALHAALLEARTPVEPALVPVADDGIAPLAGMRVLLAEDNPINQTVAVALLDYAGAAVTVAGDGAEAIARLESDPAGFDAVLMDVQMPVLDGLAATRAIRDRLQLTLPVVAMTAGVTQEERDACSMAGMDDFIAKPIEEEELVAVLRRVRGN